MAQLQNGNRGHNIGDFSSPYINKRDDTSIINLRHKPCRSFCFELVIERHLHDETYKDYNGTPLSKGLGAWSLGTNG